MILRQLISSFLIQAIFLTSINAYPSNTKTVFLMNEKRELRCQITPETVKLFSLGQLENLIQKDALAVKLGESQVSEFRPCDEDDAFYAEIVFSDLKLAEAIEAPSPIMAIILTSMGLIGIITMAIVPTGKSDDKKNLQETIKAICGERDALVTSDGVQCLDENKNKAQAEEIQ